MSKLTKSGVKVIIRNEIRNKMISARPFTFSKGNVNIKIRERCCWWGGPTREGLAGTGSEAGIFGR